MPIASSTRTAPPVAPEAFANSEYTPRTLWNVHSETVGSVSTDASMHDKVDSETSFLTTIRKVTTAIVRTAEVKLPAEVASSPDATSLADMTSALANITSPTSYAGTVEGGAHLTTSPGSARHGYTGHPDGNLSTFGSDYLASTVGSHLDDSLKDSHYTSYVICASVLVLLSFIVVSVVLWMRWRQYFSYKRLSSSGPGGYDYIYKPLQGHGLDEEYENTFVGVSVPLLQEVSKI